MVPPGPLHPPGPPPGPPGPPPAYGKTSFYCLHCYQIGLFIQQEGGGEQEEDGREQEEGGGEQEDEEEEGVEQMRNQFTSYLTNLSLCAFEILLYFVLLRSCYICAFEILLKHQHLR